MPFKILAVNPGSTSTKVALYLDERELFAKNIELSKDELAKYPSPSEQYELRKEQIIQEMEKNGFRMTDIDAYSGRSGAMASCAGGAYKINDLLLAANDIQKGAAHPSMLTTQMVADFVRDYGGEGYIVNANLIDEFIDEARVTGFKGLWRSTSAHSLNHKAVGEKAAKSRMRKYEDMNIIVAHLGGGISIAAHRRGMMIDVTGAGMGEGPFSPTRLGGLSGVYALDLAFSGDYTQRELSMLFHSGGGGLTHHLGTADAREVEMMILGGDEYAKLVYDGMIYQIAQTIGKMAVSMEGDVDLIALTGGMAHSKYLTEAIERYTKWIAPIEIFAGEFEMQAFAGTVLRVLKGEAEAKTYTGIPVFDPTRLIKAE